MNITTTDPEICRAISGDPAFVSAETMKAEPNGHKFSAGETRILTGLVDFKEFNGEPVEISAIREDGPNGRAYYIKGRINQFLNWVYEYRLT